MSRSTSAIAVFLALVAQRTTLSQQVELRLEPARTTVSSCPGDTLEVAVHLLNPSARGIGGYQVFLRFPARFFEPVRYEPEEVDGFIQTAGFGGSAYRPCSGTVTDGWSDGAGDDVVAVTASAISEQDTDLFTGRDATLGRFVFRTRGEATDGAAFAPNTQSCHPPVEQVAKVFGARGAALTLTPPSGFTVAVTDAGPSVTALSCTDLGDTVYLRWSPPPLSEVGGYVIYRNSAVIARFAVNFIEEYNDRSAPAGTLLYEVAVVARAGSEGCKASCTLERGTGARFIRGDANRDGRINITDAVTVLEHLFRGNTMSCLDAGDFDDNGGVNITDAVNILDHLFKPGDRPPVPPPFESAGSDPTADDLDCKA